jgi:hypothetical protein
VTIVPIRPGLEPPSEIRGPNPDAVALLERMLKEAQAGEIQGLAYASLHPGDLTTYGSGGRTTRGILGALTMLQFYMCKTDLEQG